ncbi:MAG: CgeB family protein [Methermicoccaceae archaeon]
MGTKKALNRANEILNNIQGKLDNRSLEVLVDEEVETHLKAGKKTVLYVGIKYDYGNRDLGLSFEHYNFYHTLLNMDYSVVYFDYDRIKQKYGNEKMSQMLREAVYYYHPDILFYFHFHDWVDHEVWKEVSEELPTKTIIWQADDHWQYEDTRAVWELFNCVATTDRVGYEKRKKEGFEDVVLSQWGCNHFLYRRLDLPRVYEVSFVGRAHGKRRQFVEALRERGVNIKTFGQGWENSDRVLQSELVRIYNQSKISLNIPLASVGNIIQLKGRDFEAPGCGSMLLTKDCEQVAEYYSVGEEIITYEDADDAAEKIRYYLAHEDERERVAERGYKRVMREHTYERRLSEVFRLATHRS